MKTQDMHAKMRRERQAEIDLLLSEMRDDLEAREAILNDTTDELLETRAKLEDALRENARIRRIVEQYAGNPKGAP